MFILWVNYDLDKICIFIIKGVNFMLKNKYLININLLLLIIYHQNDIY